MAEPHCDQAEHDGEQDIASGIEPFAIAEEIQGLQAEGGEGGVTPADAGHEQLDRSGHQAPRSSLTEYLAQ